MLDEFYRVAFRKRIYGSIEELQQDLDAWLANFNPVSYCPTSLCH